MELHRIDFYINKLRIVSHIFLKSKIYIYIYGILFFPFLIFTLSKVLRQFTTSIAQLFTQHSQLFLSSITIFIVKKQMLFSPS